MRVSTWMLACGIAALLAASLAPAASAQTVASTLERWGLFGTWSEDCSRSPSPGQGGRLSYRPLQGGKVLHERDFGTSRDSREILMAAIIPGGPIEIFASFEPVGGMRRWVFVKGADGRIKTVENSRIDGTEATIENGRFRDGRETRWLSKCDGLRDQARGI